MKITTKQVYESDDGKQFDSEAECREHERVEAARWVISTESKDEFIALETFRAKRLTGYDVHTRGAGYYIWPMGGQPDYVIVCQTPMLAANQFLRVYKSRKENGGQPRGDFGHPIGRSHSPQEFVIRANSLWVDGDRVVGPHQPFPNTLHSNGFSD